jgi:hypothetical protein
VLYQLSYCGGPCAFGKVPKTPAPDIGRPAILQEKRWSGMTYLRIVIPLYLFV